MSFYLTDSDWQSQLISLYLWIEDMMIHKGYQCFVERFSPNRTPPCFTDIELLTAFFFARLQKQVTHRDCLTFIEKFLPEWFPNLPKYSRFVDRLNRVQPVLIPFVEHLLQPESPQGQHYMIDSCPLVMVKGSRARRAKVAPELQGNAYCAARQLHYSGLKLHVLAQRRPCRMPYPVAISVSSARQADISALRDLENDVPSGIIWADKAYDSKDLSDKLQERGCELRTPRKRYRNTFHFKSIDTPSKTVSQIRQPIESLFAWLTEQTDLQRVHRARSARGALFFVWSSLCIGLILLNSL